jgi:hypothetical protein
MKTVKVTTYTQGKRLEDTMEVYESPAELVAAVPGENLLHVYNAHLVKEVRNWIREEYRVQQLVEKVVAAGATERTLRAVLSRSPQAERLVAEMFG